MVYTRYFSCCDCQIPLSTTHCCSNVSIYRTKSINLVIILDLIHLTAWSDLPSLIKKYYLPTGVNNIVDVLQFNIPEDVVAICCE